MFIVVAANVDKENRTIENLLNIDMNASIEILRHRQDSPVPDFSNKGMKMTSSVGTMMCSSSVSNARSY